MEYLWAKAAHVVAAAMLLGHSVSTLMLAAAAHKSREAAVVSFTRRFIKVSDFVIVATTVTAVFATGVVTLEIGRLPFHSSRWAVAGSGLFGFAIFCWLAVLVPIQIRLSKRDSRSLEWAWVAGKVVVIFALIASTVVMVTKLA